MKKGSDRDMAIGTLVVDLGKGAIKPIAKVIDSCFRKELIDNYKEYDQTNCLCENTLRRILNDLGYRLRRVSKKLVI